MSIKKIEALAKKHGVACAVKPNGHVQLKGDLLVNYYPESKKRTAYVAGTTRGKQRVTPEDAIAMCFSPPPIAYGSDVAKRGSNSRRKRQALILKGVCNCFWCGEPLTLDTSTLEHKIPLKRGGLDNANNRTLACLECNNKRGHDMPELNKGASREK